MNEFPGLVDSHFHLLSLEQKGLDPAACVREFFDAGGRWALDVAVHPDGWDRRLTFGEAEPRLWFTAGVHPGDLEGLTDRRWADLEAQTLHPRCLAVGEIGLDWYRGRDNAAAQHEAFRRQLGLAARRGKPVVIHNREADAELIADVEAEAWTGTGILHCFSSDLTLARWALDHGFWLSFAGNLTYKTADTLRQVAAWAPADRLLVETDAPYLAPQAVRGKPSRPVHAGHTAAFLAGLRGQPLAEVLRRTGDNFAALFGLPY